MEEGRDWQPFQTAAGSLTLLYKDSLDELQKAAGLNRKLVGTARLLWSAELLSCWWLVTDDC